MEPGCIQFYSRLLNVYPSKQASKHVSTETTPLIPHISSGSEASYSQDEKKSKSAIFWEEVRTIPLYALPVFWCASIQTLMFLVLIFYFSTHILDYSLIFVSVISIGHLSTKSLAAISLGSMTASVTGLSIIQGLASALDTVLPSAWTSPQPHLVGLWAQRMSSSTTLLFLGILK